MYADKSSSLGECDEGKSCGHFVVVATASDVMKWTCIIHIHTHTHTCTNSYLSTNTHTHTHTQAAAASKQASKHLVDFFLGLFVFCSHTLPLLQDTPSICAGKCVCVCVYRCIWVEGADGGGWQCYLHECRGGGDVVV
jgi:hypothetical protein